MLQNQNCHLHNFSTKLNLKHSMGQYSMGHLQTIAMKPQKQTYKQISFGYQNTHHKICRGSLPRNNPTCVISTQFVCKGRANTEPSWHFNSQPLDLLGIYLILTQYVCRGRSPAPQNKPTMVPPKFRAQTINAKRSKK